MYGFLLEWKKNRQWITGIIIEAKKQQRKGTQRKSLTGKYSFATTRLRPVHLGPDMYRLTFNRR